MAKKKRGFHGIHIHPKAGTHYEVRHDPKMEQGEQGAVPMMPDDEENTKLFRHDERDQLHSHIDRLMDAHEGAKGSDDKSDMMADHPMNRLKARRPY